MGKLGLFALFYCVTFNLSAQSFGYMGKKNLISVSSDASGRLFCSVLDYPFGEVVNVGNNRFVYDNNNQLEVKKKFVRWDARLAYSRLLTKKIGLGAEFSYTNLRLAFKNAQMEIAGDYYNTSGAINSIAHVATSPVFNVFGGYLVFDYYSSRFSAPLGFRLSIGIGPRFYSFDASKNYRIDSNTEIVTPFPQYKKDMMGIHGFVGLNTRRLLTSYMAIDFGMRLNLGGVFRRGVELKSGGYSDERSVYSFFEEASLPPSEPILYTKRDVQKWVNGETMGNLFSFKFGLTFML